MDLIEELDLPTSTDQGSLRRDERGKSRVQRKTIERIERSKAIRSIQQEANILMALERTSCQGCSGFAHKACAVCRTEEKINEIVLDAQLHIFALHR